MYTDSRELANFRNLCSVSIIVDEDDKNPILCVSATTRNQTYRRCVQLTPLMEMLAAGIRSYHDMLHESGEYTGFSFPSPFGRKKRAARNKAVFGKTRGSRGRSGTRSPSRESSRESFQSREEYPEEQYQEEQYPEEQYLEEQYPQEYYPPQPSYGPYGPTLDQMRAGPPSPYGPTLADMRAGILPPGQDPLMVQGWYDTIVKTARQLGEAKAVKNLYHDLKSLAKNKQVQAIALSAFVGPAAPLILEAAYKAHDTVVAAKSGNVKAIAKLQILKEAADSGNHAAAQTLETAKNINDKINDKAYEQSIEVRTHQQIGGWLYNRPYRTALDVVTAPLRGEFPSVGLALRQGWHDALDFAKTMERKPLFKMEI